MEIRSKSYGWIKYLYAILIYAVLTIVFTYPLITRLSTHVPGSYSDNLYFAWQIGWIRKAIFEYHQNPLKTDLINFPYGYSLLFTEISPLQILFGLPFVYGDNAILGFNISILLTFALAGLAMFSWSLHLTESFFISLVVGFAYTFSPFHFSHFLVGHLNLCAIQWFPLYFWGLLGLLNDDGHAKRNIALCAFGISCISLTSLYYFYMSLVITAAILLYYGVHSLVKKTRHPLPIRSLAVTALIALPGVLAGVGPYLIYHVKRGTQRMLSEALVYSASITDFLLPFTKQVLFGKWVGRNFPRNLWIESSLYLGMVIIILAVFGWAAKKSPSKKITSGFLLAGFLTSLILAMGTAVVWMEEPLTIKTPLLFGGAEGSDMLIRLPSYLLYKYLPFYAIMRVPMRYGIFAMFFACSAAALGLQSLLEKVRPKFQPVFKSMILVLFLLDFWITPISTSPISPRAVDLWLADQPEGAVLQLPFALALKQEQIFYTLYHHKPAITIMPTFPSDRMQQLRQELDAFPDGESMAVLLRENVEYLVIDAFAVNITPDDALLITENGFVFQGDFDGQLVFSRQ